MHGDKAELKFASQVAKIESPRRTCLVSDCTGRRLREYSFPLSERSSAWLEHLVWDQDVAGSNPVAPTISLCGSTLAVFPRLQLAFLL